MLTYGTEFAPGTDRAGLTRGGKDGNLARMNENSDWELECGRTLTGERRKKTASEFRVLDHPKTPNSVLLRWYPQLSTGSAGQRWLLPRRASVRLRTPRELEQWPARVWFLRVPYRGYA